jgi:tryptophanyl-tRNA synthetase
LHKKTILTGITTTGTPHLGNYAGAIRQAIRSSKKDDCGSFLFLADYHSLIKNKNPKEIKQSCLEVAATWIALGLDTSKTIFYRQSDIPEILELNWILSTFTAKGLMNRAHAYKSAVSQNEGNSDHDKGITMGLYSYPILMAADILMFKASYVPVGQDQVQHLEMTRDIAQRFNHKYGEIFVIPEAILEKNATILPGLDGRKMSKSYNNFIPLFSSSDELRRKVMKIKTNSLEPGVPKPTECSLYDIYKAFASVDESTAFRKKLEEGISWGDAKEDLFQLLDSHLSAPRKEYQKLIKDPENLNQELLVGAKRAREWSVPYMSEIRGVLGIGSLV